MIKPFKCAVALGSNAETEISKSAGLVDCAIDHLSRSPLKLLKKSNFYRTTAFPDPSDPDFINAVVLCESPINVKKIISTLKKIEEDMGREPKKRWAQRKIDLDLLYVDQVVYPDLHRFEYWHKLPFNKQTKLAPDDLILPHPRLQDRAFVLIPLCDVASGWIHPVMNKSAGQLKSDLAPELLSDVRLFRRV